MKKLKNVLIGIGIIIVVITGITIISFKILMPSKKIGYRKSNLEKQEEIINNLEKGNYSFEEPKVVVNPFGISPLTAMVMFYLDQVDTIKVMVMDKDGVNGYQYEIEGKKNNYIPIYGLYPNYENTVVIRCKDKKIVLKIKTSDIDSFEIIDNYKDKDISFVSEDNYSYAIDRNGDIRWYLEGYAGNLNWDSNGHFLMHSERKIDKNYYTGLVEVDMLGKIYYEYTIDTGVKGSYVKMDDNNVYVSSLGYIDLLNLQSGDIRSKLKIDISCNNMEYDDNVIKCFNDNGTYEINKETGEYKELNKDNLSSKIYYNDMNRVSKLRISKGISLGDMSTTKTIKKMVWLFNYKKLSDKDIDIYEERDRIVVEGKFSSETFVIMEGLGEKKIYKLDQNKDDNYYKYINKKGLKGRYSIYFKEGEKLYRSNYYVVI